jgi:hypothetical protein
MKYLDIFFKIVAIHFFIIIGCFVGYAIYGTLLNFLNGDLFSESIFQDMITLKIAVSAFIGLLVGLFTSLTIYFSINNKSV